MCFSPNFEVSKSKPFGKEFEFESKIDFKAYTHFMFMVLSDCMLEEYPAHVPALRFHIDFKNGGSHLPADEKFMPAAHLALCILLVGLIVYFFVQLRKQVCFGFPLYFAVLACALNSALIYSRESQAVSFGQVHLISLLLGAAMLLQLGAAALELLHLRAYSIDGIGFGGVGLGTLGTRVCQAASEMIVSCTLIAVALGWTLVAQDGGAASSKSWQQTISLVVSVVVGVQLALEIVSSTYNDELNQFHDYEHVPGYVLMAFRSMLGVFFFLKITGTAQRESEGSPLLALLRQLRIQGTSWFVAFPVLVLMGVCLLRPVSMASFAGLSSRCSC